MKRPSFQFYPADFMRDVDDLSPAARGAWISLLCKMHWSRPRGQYRSDMKGLARIMGTTADHAEALIREITQREVCDLVYHEDATVTVTNRRMSREEKERESTRLRVDNYRKRKCNAKVTSYSSSSSSSSVTKTPPTPPSQAGGRASPESEDQKRVGVEVEEQKPDPPAALAAWETVLKSFGDMRILPTLDGVIKRTLDFMGGHDEVRYAYKDKPEVIRGQFMQYYRGFREGA